MCVHCGTNQQRLRVKRSFIERYITHKNQYKFYCPICKRKAFVAIGDK